MNVSEGLFASEGLKQIDLRAVQVRQGFLKCLISQFPLVMHDLIWHI